MKKEKTQSARIFDSFVAVTIVLVSVMLVAAGMSISKINTEYMSTGVRAAKIIAEREADSISLQMNERIVPLSQSDFSVTDTVLTLLPPPINTGYLIYKEVTK